MLCGMKDSQITSKDLRKKIQFSGYAKAARGALITFQRRSQSLSTSTKAGFMGMNLIITRLHFNVAWYPIITSTPSSNLRYLYRLYNKDIIYYEHG